MRRNKIATEANLLLMTTVGEVEEPMQKLVDAVDSGIVGSVDELKELQRRLVLIARDATAAASSLFSSIRLAESDVRLANAEEAVEKRKNK